MGKWQRCWTPGAAGDGKDVRRYRTDARICPSFCHYDDRTKSRVSGVGVESDRSATNSTGVSVDADRVDCLVEKTSLRL